MRILQVISSLDPAGGGPAEEAKLFARASQELGHKVEILTLDAIHDSWISDTGVKVHAVGPAFLHYRYTPRLVPWLREHIGEFDAVIVHGIWQYSSFGVWRVMHKTQIPYFVYMHGMLDPWFKKAYPLKHIKKWLYWPWAEYRVLRDAKAAIFTCEQERLLARKSFWLYRCSEMIASYGIALPEREEGSKQDVFFNRFPQLRNKRVLLYLSRIHPKKGCDLLIEAFNQVSGKDESLHLVMAGPDQVGWQGALQKRAEELGASDRITWTGMLSGSLKWGAFHAAEIFILPSHQENFGIAVAEALARGTPALISDKVNIWREIKSDNAGLVSTDDLKGTVELLGKWLTLSDREREAMKQNARKCFLKRFEVHETSQRLIDSMRRLGVGG